MPYNDKHWASFFRVAGRPELTKDQRFADQPSRSENIDALYGIIADVMPSRTTADWLSVLEEADVPVLPMNTPEELFECPHLSAVGMFPEVDHPSEGRIRHLKVPVHFSKTPGGYYRPTDRLGESTEAVLEEIGYSPEEIASLQADSAAGKFTE